MKLPPMNAMTASFFTFTIFALCQNVAAYIAGSEAMMGDTAAMYVDASTYLFNLVAERRKHQFEQHYVEPPQDLDPQRRAKLKERAKRKLILYMELIPPIVSVVVLLCVTVVVLKESITVLKLDIHRNRSEQGDPNVNLMLIFSSLNLLLDVVNVFCFAKAKRLCGYETSTKHVVPGEEEQIIMTSNTPRRECAQLQQATSGEDHYYDDNDEEEMDYEEPMSFEERIKALKECSSSSDDHDAIEEAAASTDAPADDCNSNHVSTVDHSSSPSIIIKENNGEKTTNGTMVQKNGILNNNWEPQQHKFEDEYDDDEIQEEANLNMCSAYTHVFADTLQSIAVICAATIAEFANGVTSEEADATAAVIVSILIILSLVLLFRGLVGTCGELYSIWAEEQDEELCNNDMTV